MAAKTVEGQPREPVIDVLSKQFDQFSRSEQKVAKRIIKSPKAVTSLNVSQLAEMCQVSDATVVRLCQHAGYSGYYEMRIFLMRDCDNGHEEEAGFTATDPISYSFEFDLLLLKTLNRPENRQAIKDAADMITGAHAVYIAAIGNTTPVANDLEFRLNTLGVKSFTAEKIETQLRYLPNADSEDVVVIISKSGESLGLSKLVEMATEKGLKIIAITGAGVSPLANAADIVISAGQIEKIFTQLKPRVASHLPEFYLLDALVFEIDARQRREENAPSGEELELVLSSFKM